MFQQFRNLNYTNLEVIELNNRDDGTQIQAVLGELTGATSVSNYFIRGRSIQCSYDLRKLLIKCVIICLDHFLCIPGNKMITFLY